MRKEYPPMLYGRPEEQLAQLRRYLVRLIGYIDEGLREAARGGVDGEALKAWQQDIEDAIGTLRSNARKEPLLQYGTAEAGDFTFPRTYAEVPIVLLTAGTASNVSRTGFTASAATQWIAVGKR